MTPLEVERGTSLTTTLKEEPAFVWPGEMDIDVDEPLDVIRKGSGAWYHTGIYYPGMI